MAVACSSMIEIDFTFEMGLRGYHVYKSDWNPHINQYISFRREHGNEHDDFAVAGYAKLPGKPNRSIVGHVPIELSRFIWFVLGDGANINAKVISDRHRCSPLLQGGLEIPVRVAVQWHDGRSLEILKERVEAVRYNVDNDYVDDSKSILLELLGEELPLPDEESTDEEMERDTSSPRAATNDVDVSVDLNDKDDEEADAEEDEPDLIINARPYRPRPIEISSSDED